MGLFSRWRSKSTPTAAPVEDRFARQCRWEDEGGRAGIAGLRREDCPYDQWEQHEAWNFWVYGRENAVGELRTIQNGYIDLCTTSQYSTPSRIPLKTAIDMGYFKPKYAPLPSSD